MFAFWKCDLGSRLGMGNVLQLYSIDEEPEIKLSGSSSVLIATNAQMSINGYNSSGEAGCIALYLFGHVLGQVMAASRSNGSSI